MRMSKESMTTELAGHYTHTQAKGLVADKPEKSSTVSISIRYLPIILAMVWLWGSVALFAFGPYDYPVRNGPLLYSYLVAAHLALFMGYSSRANARGAAYQGKWQPAQMLRLSLVLTLVVVISSFLLGQGGVLGFRAALEDPGQAYNLYGQSQGTTLLPYILIFLEPFTAPFLILAAYYWQSVGAAVRWTSVLVLAFNVLGAVSIAVRGAIVFQIITVGGAFLAAFFGGRLKPKAPSKLLVMILVVAGTILLLAYFLLIYTERGGGVSATFNPSAGQFPNPDHPIVQMVPESLQPLVMGTITYLTHGYYGLSLALDKPFEGVGFGITSSMFLQRNFERLTGSTALSDVSYADRLRMEDGYPVGNWWMSIYPWIASDVTWIGSLVILFLIGRLFAQSWLDAVQGGNPAAVIVFVFLAYLIYSFPMNNPFQDGSAITRTYFWLFFWWFTRARRPRVVSIMKPVRPIERHSRFIHR